MASFSLPHNAPLTPPSDVPQITESSKNRATTSDTAEDDHRSFSDEDAEALMLVGDDISNIHPDNITEAWESWTRDCDVSRSKPSPHLTCTANTWISRRMITILRSNGNRIGRKACGLGILEERQKRLKELPPRNTLPPDLRSLFRRREIWPLLNLLSHLLRKSTRSCQSSHRKSFLKVIALPPSISPRPLCLSRFRLILSHNRHSFSNPRGTIVLPEVSSTPSHPTDPRSFPLTISRFLVIEILQASRRPEAGLIIRSHLRGQR